MQNHKSKRMVFNDIILDLQDIRVLGCKRLPLLHTVVLVHSREQIMLGREGRGGERKKLRSIIAT